MLLTVSRKLFSSQQTKEGKFSRHTKRSQFVFGTLKEANCLRGTRFIIKAQTKKLGRLDRWHISIYKVADNLNRL